MHTSSTVLLSFALRTSRTHCRSLPSKRFKHDSVSRMLTCNHALAVRTWYPSGVQYHLLSRRLLLQCALHRPLCVLGRRSLNSPAPTAHPSLPHRHSSSLPSPQLIPPFHSSSLPSSLNMTPPPIEPTSVAMGLRPPPSLPSHVNMLTRVPHPLECVAHPLAWARTSAGLRSRAACSGAPILLRLQVGASGPPGP